MLFETAEKNMNTTSLKHALSQYLKQFVSAQKILKTIISKACILTVFQTIWKCREQIKTISLKKAF